MSIVAAEGKIIKMTTWHFQDILKCQRSICMRHFLLLLALNWMYIFHPKHSSNLFRKFVTFYLMRKPLKNVAFHLLCDFDGFHAQKVSKIIKTWERNFSQHTIYLAELEPTHKLVLLLQLLMLLLPKHAQSEIESFTESITWRRA